MSHPPLCSVSDRSRSSLSPGALYTTQGPRIVSEPHRFAPRMLGHFSTPVLSVTADAVKDLDGVGLWNGMCQIIISGRKISPQAVFSKCKGSLAEGERLEYVSWRLWHREMSANNSFSPISSSATTPSSEKDMPLLMSPSPSPVSVQLEEYSPTGMSLCALRQICPLMLTCSH